MHFFEYVYNFAIRKTETQTSPSGFQIRHSDEYPMVPPTSILAFSSNRINSYLKVCGVLTDFKNTTTSNKWIIRCKLKIRELIKSIIKAQVVGTS